MHGTATKTLRGVIARGAVGVDQRATCSSPAHAPDLPCRGRSWCAVSHLETRYMDLDPLEVFFHVSPLNLYKAP